MLDMKFVIKYLVSLYTCKLFIIVNKIKAYSKLYIFNYKNLHVLFYFQCENQSLLIKEFHIL